jgi:hypothetical protein
VRVFALCLAIVLLLSAPVLAVAPVNKATISAAQDYGHGRADVPLADFLRPWTVYEENAARLDDSTERACLYTPFLLVAADARDRTAAGEAVNVAMAEKVLADYNGYVIVGVTLSGLKADFAGKCSASLRQGRKSFRAKLVNGPSAALTGEAPYIAKVYFYFTGRDIAPDRPASLAVTAADGRTRLFRLPFAGVR